MPWDCTPVQPSSRADGASCEIRFAARRVGSLSLFESAAIRRAFCDIPELRRTERDCHCFGQK